MSVSQSLRRWVRLVEPDVGEAGGFDEGMQQLMFASEIQNGRDVTTLGQKPARGRRFDVSRCSTQAREARIGPAIRGQGVTNDLCWLLGSQRLRPSDPGRRCRRHRRPCPSAGLKSTGGPGLNFPVLTSTNSIRPHATSGGVRCGMGCGPNSSQRDPYTRPTSPCTGQGGSRLRMAEPTARTGNLLDPSRHTPRESTCSPVACNST